MNWLQALRKLEFMNNENKLGFLNQTVIIFTLYALVALVADTFGQLKMTTQKNKSRVGKGEFHTPKPLTAPYPV